MGRSVHFYILAQDTKIAVFQFALAAISLVRKSKLNFGWEFYLIYFFRMYSVLPENDLET